MLTKMHSTAFLDLTDTQNAFWWEKLNVNIFVVYKKTPRGTLKEGYNSRELPGLTLRKFKYKDIGASYSWQAEKLLSHSHKTLEMIWYDIILYDAAFRHLIL